jgi:hypothetical protein
MKNTVPPETLPMNIRQLLKKKVEIGDTICRFACNINNKQT